MDDYASNSFTSFAKKFGLIIFLGVVGFVSLLYGLMQYLPQSKNADVSFDSPQASQVTPMVEQKFMVDISGAVRNPGVYAFGGEDRIVDAIKKAGGLAANADTSYIAKSVNEAMKLADGMKIYIPKVGESVPQTSVAGTSNSVLGATTGLISINSATESELDSLPGVGAVTAGKIIGSRPYTSVEELISKKVISSSVYAKIKDKISL